jgi:hypothetical protein
VEPPRPEGPDNFTPLTALDWQVHVYGERAPDVRARCEERKIAHYTFPFGPAAKRAGFRDEAVYLVRPDGYLGAVFAGDEAPKRLTAYFDAHGVRGRAG